MISALLNFVLQKVVSLGIRKLNYLTDLSIGVYGSLDKMVTFPLYPCCILILQ